jgi:hypothetical protein
MCGLEECVEIGEPWRMRMIPDLEESETRWSSCMGDLSGHMLEI